MKHRIIIITLLTIITSVIVVAFFISRPVVQPKPVITSPEVAREIPKTPTTTSYSKKYMDLLESHHWGTTSNESFNLSDHTTLTKNLLTQNNWGPEKSIFGWWIEFYDDKTFNAWQAGIHEAELVTGTYAIDGDVLTLNNQFLNDEPILNESWFPTTFILGISNTSPFLIQYLKQDDEHIFWNHSSWVPPGTGRTIAEQDVNIVNNARTPKATASIYAEPNTHGGKMIFTSCESGCQIFGTDEVVYNEIAPIDEVVTRVVARTSTKSFINDKHDYWYCVQIAPMIRLAYPSLYIDNEESSLEHEFAWIHGSDLE